MVYSPCSKSMWVSIIYTYTHTYTHMCIHVHTEEYFRREVMKSEHHEFTLVSRNIAFRKGSSHTLRESY